jgi:hypothetical protein
MPCYFIMHILWSKHLPLLHVQKDKDLWGRATDLFTESSIRIVVDNSPL